MQNRGTSPAEPGWPWPQTAPWVQSRGQKEEEVGWEELPFSVPGQSGRGVEANDAESRHRKYVPQHLEAAGIGTWVSEWPAWRPMR